MTFPFFVGAENQVEDWRDPAKYPKKITDLTEHQAMWEVVRRTKKYQEIWCETRLPEGVNSLELWQDPRNPNPGRFMPPTIPDTIFFGDELTDGELRITLTETQVCVIYDMAQSLSHQFDNIERELRRVQYKREGKFVRELGDKVEFGKLLRIMDARAQTPPITYAEIGKVVLGKVDYADAAASATQDHEQAENFWREIPGIFKKLRNDSHNKLMRGRKANKT